MRQPDGLGITDADIDFVQWRWPSTPEGRTVAECAKCCSKFWTDGSSPLCPRCERWRK